MDEDTLRRLLAAVRARDTSVDEAVRRLKGAPFERLGDLATLDTHRALRVGMPEVVLAEAKTAAALANRDSMDVKARELGLRLHPGANVHILPAQAGHVGAVNVGVLLGE